MDDAPKAGTGRLGRGAHSSQAPSYREVRSFLESDFARRVAVLVAGLLSLVVLLQFRTTAGSLPDATSGLFDPAATPLSPARVGHAIWLPALAAFGLYAVWVWLPWSRRSRRVHVTAYPATVSMLLMACWVAAVGGGHLRSSWVLVVAVWVSLVVTLARSARAQSVGFVDRQITQMPFAILLGWMTVMAAAELGLVAKVWGVRPWQVPPETWWVLGVLGIFAVAMALVRYLPGRVITGAAIAWGLVTIAYGRLFGEPRAYWVAVVCIVSALLVLVASVSVLMWQRTRRLY